MTLGTHTVGGGVEEVLSTGDPILVGTACGPAVLRAHPSESIDAASVPVLPAQSKQVSKKTHFRGKRDLLYADF